jgi:hypothetical protein
MEGIEHEQEFIPIKVPGLRCGSIRDTGIDDPDAVIGDDAASGV